MSVGTNAKPICQHDDTSVLSIVIDTDGSEQTDPGRGCVANRCHLEELHPAHDGDEGPKREADICYQYRCAHDPEEEGGDRAPDQARVLAREGAQTAPQVAQEDDPEEEAQGLHPRRRVRPPHSAREGRFK